VLLADLWPLERDTVLERGIALASDDDWEVREWAAHIFGAALNRDFAAEYPAMLELAAHPHEGVRRAIALAVMDAARRDRPERAAPLLAIVERLLPDTSEYVRRNLGPFALGAALLRAYPDETHLALDRWVSSASELTRWNVAMACGSAAALRHSAATRALLDRLMTGDSRLVRSAARAALRRHQRHAASGAAGSRC
jgi:HEAT repeat protein